MAGRLGDAHACRAPVPKTGILPRDSRVNPAATRFAAPAIRFVTSQGDKRPLQPFRHPGLVPGSTKPHRKYLRLLPVA